MIFCPASRGAFLYFLRMKKATTKVMAKFNFTANIARPPALFIFYSEVSNYRVMVRRVYAAAVK